MKAARTAASFHGRRQAVHAARATGQGMSAIAPELGMGTGTVQRILGPQPVRTASISTSGVSVTGHGTPLVVPYRASDGSLIPEVVARVHKAAAEITGLAGGGDQITECGWRCETDNREIRKLVQV